MSFPTGPLGLFVLFAILEKWMGSEEEHAAKALTKVLEHQGQANADELHAANAQAAAVLTAAPAVVAPAALPAHATPAAAPTTTVPLAAPATTPVVTTPAGPATPAAAPQPFPVAVPPSLPAWPDNFQGGAPPAGWKFSPTPPAVVQRAWALLNQLWKTGAGSHVAEMTAGQWTLYNAEAHANGVKGVTAYTPAKAGS
jgi:hypothetical protein